MKFYGQFDPPVDRFIFERYFPEIGIKGVFVECGAFDGTVESSCKFFEETAGWTGFNIEPVPYLFQKLAENRPISRNLQLALSDASGQIIFSHAIHPELGPHFGNGSIGHADEHMKDLLERNCTFEQITVETLTWRDFVARENIGRVDLFVLDVEGHELKVLDGMRGSHVMPAIMCVEFGHVGFTELVQIVESLGYVYDIHSAANAYFVRSDLVSLFALRACSRSSKEETTFSSGQMNVAKQEIERLRLREAELTNLLDIVRASKWARLGIRLKLLGPF